MTVSQRLNPNPDSFFAASPTMGADCGGQDPGFLAVLACGQQVSVVILGDNLIATEHDDTTALLEVVFEC